MNTAQTLTDYTPSPALAGRILRAAALVTAFTFYVALASASTIIFPPAGVAFLIPLAIAIIAAAPQGKSVPRSMIMSLLVVAAVLLPVWPVYLHVKIGPLPIMTPPRLALYALTALWAYDMTFSPLRRGQFILAMKKSRWVTGLVFAFFALGLLSLPMAQGRSIAAPEFFRQVIIWLLPYCAILTYVRRQRDFVTLIKAFSASSAIVGVIALAELASKQLMAGVLSPLIGDGAEWLRIAQSQKIRDGAFRAQASHTHPLSLGEHLAIAAPFALAFAFTARKMNGRLLWALALIVIVGGAIATNSRGAALVMLISFAAALGIVAHRQLKRAASSRFRPLAGLAVLCFVVASPVIAVGAHAVITGSTGASAANSSQSRIDQFEQAWPKILKRPVLGYGTGRAARVLGYWGMSLTIDNYYLTLALDLGLPGPLVFFAIMIAFGGSALKRSRNAQGRLAYIFIACFSAACVIAISRLVISQTGNLTTIYFLLAAFAGASVTLSPRRSRNVL